MTTDQLVTAIRTDPLVGTGTGSMMSRAVYDETIARALTERRITTVAEALVYAYRWENREWDLWGGMTGKGDDERRESAGMSYNEWLERRDERIAEIEAQEAHNG
jgi:hypothetical protein